MKNKWQPEKWGTEKRTEVKRMLSVIYGQTRQLERCLVHNSSNIDITYDNLFTAVDSMYNLLELDKLALDNNRREKEHKQKVRKSVRGNSRQ
jgi:hypothetical protein